MKIHADPMDPKDPDKKAPAPVKVADPKIHSKEEKSTIVTAGALLLPVEGI